MPRSFSSFTSRRRFLLAALGTSALALAACLPETQPTPTTKPAAAPAPADKPAAPAAAKPSTSGAQATNLVAWFTNRLTINKMTEEIAKPEFESRNPNIKVEVQFVPEGEILAKARTAKAAGNAPDVISIDETFLDDMFRDKMLLPIPDQLINVNQEMGRRTGYLYRIPHGAADAKYYSLPNGMFGGALYYNEALLAELKMTPEQIPTSWDELLKWAQSVTTYKGDAVDRSGFAVFGAEPTMMAEYRVQKGGFETGTQFEKKDKINLTRQLEIDAHEWALDFYRKWKVDDKSGITQQQRFGQGKAVTTLAYTWHNGFYQQNHPDLKWGTMLPPRFEQKGPYGEHSPDVGFAVASQKPDNHESAWKLWRYLVGPDYQRRYALPRGVQPSLKELWKEKPFDGTGDKQWLGVAKKNVPPNGMDSGFSTIELNQITGVAWGPIRDQGANIKEKLTEVETRANEYLKTRPMWSRTTWEDWKAHPEWQQPEG